MVELPVVASLDCLKLLENAIIPKPVKTVELGRLGETRERKGEGMGVRQREGRGEEARERKGEGERVREEASVKRERRGEEEGRRGEEQEGMGFSSY